MNQSSKFKNSMIKGFLSLAILGMVFFFSGCKKKAETPPTPVVEDPAITTFTQKVVVEKYTGEWCGSCPAAATFFEDMKTTYGNKFIGVGIHAGSSNDRYKDNPANTTMYSYLNAQLRDPGFSGTIGFPNVMFMRSLNPLNSAIINGYSNSDWNKKVADEIAKPSSCGLSLVTSISGSTLSTTVKFQISKELPLKYLYAITAYVVENNLDGSLQVNASPGFKHQHVLRELLTPKEGTYIDVATLGKPFELKLSDVNISAYNASNLEVIAFIHKRGSSYDERQIINGQIVKAGQIQKFD